MIDTSNKKIRIAFVFLSIFLVLFGIRCVKKVVRGNDFFMHQVGQRVMAGEAIYPEGSMSDGFPGMGIKKRPYLYPAAPAVVTAPLAYIPDWAAGLIWYLLKLSLVVLTFPLTQRLFKTFDLPPPNPAVLLLGFILVARFFENDFLNGQVNIIIFFLILASFYLYALKREITSGILIGLALGIKQPVLLFVAYWGMRFKWKVLLGCAIGAIAFFYLIPGSIVGFSKIHSYNTQWFNTVIYSPEGTSLAQEAGSDSTAHGSSLLGFMGKYLRHADASNHSDTPVYINVVDWSTHTVSLLHKAFALFSVTGLFLLSLRRSDSLRLRNWRILCEMAIVGTLTLLISPISHKAHFVMMYLTAVLTVYSYWQLQRKSRLVLTCLVMAFIGFVLRTGTLTIYGSITISCLALLVANVYLHLSVQESDFDVTEKTESLSPTSARPTID